MQNTTTATPSLTATRLSVAIFFFINGFTFANWVARIPEVQQRYGFDNATLGTVLLCAAVGALLAMPFTGVLTVRFGSRVLTIAAALFFCAAVPFISLLNTFWPLAFLVFIIGAVSGALDVAMNAQAVLLEKRIQKPIMSSFHAVFSVGTAIGAGSGALFTRWQVPLGVHFWIVAALGIVAILLAMPKLLPDDPHQNTADAPAFQLPTKAILPLGLIAFCGMMGEGSMADWSALYVNKTVGQSESIAALAFGAFATAMTIGRLLGDHFTQKWGEWRMLVGSSLVAFLGLLLLIAVPQIAAVMVGFFLTGVGLAVVVPIVYSAAGNTPGVSPSVGIAMATTIGYAGFFVGPPSIGYLADAFSLRWAFLFPLGLFVLMFILAYSRKK